MYLKLNRDATEDPEDEFYYKRNKRYEIYQLLQKQIAKLLDLAWFDVLSGAIGGGSREIHSLYGGGMGMERIYVPWC